MPSSAADAETAAAATAVGATPGKKLESMDEVLSALLGCVQALAESKAVTKEGVDNHTSTREAGGIPPLMLLSASDTKPAVTDAAVAALGALAASTANHAQLAAGVVGGGSRWSRSSRCSSRGRRRRPPRRRPTRSRSSRHAVSAAAVRHGGVAAIVHILNISQKGASVVHPGALRGAVDALGQLAARHEEAAHVRDGHGAKALVALLKTTLAAAATAAPRRSRRRTSSPPRSSARLQPRGAAGVRRGRLRVGVAALVALCIPATVRRRRGGRPLQPRGDRRTLPRARGGRIAKLVFLCQGHRRGGAQGGGGAAPGVHRPRVARPDPRPRHRRAGQLLHNHRAASAARARRRSTRWRRWRSSRRRRRRRR